jgi:hypothetical protein
MGAKGALDSPVFVGAMAEPRQGLEDAIRQRTSRKNGVAGSFHNRIFHNVQALRLA